MNDRFRLRLSGAAAIAGGVLRIADCFTEGALSPHTVQIGYWLTDVLLLLGLLGIYLGRRDALGWIGLTSFVTCLVGILTIRSTGLFGASNYMIGATALLVGLSILSVRMLAGTGRPRRAAQFAPVCWLISLALGIAVLVAPGFTWSTTLAGISFGLGFVLAGLGLVQLE